MLSMAGQSVGFNSFPWDRIPLKASPGVGYPEVIDGNRTSGVLSDPEVAWLAAHHDIIILSAATQDPGNKSVCGESKIADTARRIKIANANTRVFVYFPSSRDESSIQHYCGEDLFDTHPEWRVKLPNGADFIVNNAYTHDLAQPAVRAWWIAAATNASFFGRDFDGVFADNAIATSDQLVTANGVHQTKAAGSARGFSLLRVFFPLLFIRFVAAGGVMQWSLVHPASRVELVSHGC
jgi:hypothetical protein